MARTAQAMSNIPWRTCHVRKNVLATSRKSILKRACVAPLSGIAGSKKRRGRKADFLQQQHVSPLRLEGNVESDKLQSCDGSKRQKICISPYFRRPARSP